MRGQRMSRFAGFSRCFELNHAPPLCGSRQFPFEFQPCGRTPRRSAWSLTAALKGGNPPTPVLIVYGVDYQVSNPVCYPTLPSLSQSVTDQRVAFRHWCSSIYLLASPLLLIGIPLSSSALVPSFHDPLVEPAWPSDSMKPPAPASLRPINPTTRLPPTRLPRLC